MINMQDNTIDFSRLNENQVQLIGNINECFQEDFEYVKNSYIAYLENNKSLDPYINAALLDTFSDNYSLQEVSIFDVLETSFLAMDNKENTQMQKLEWAGIFNKIYNFIFKSDLVSKIPKEKRNDLLSQWVRVHNILEPRN